MPTRGHGGYALKVMRGARGGQFDRGVAANIRTAKPVMREARMVARGALRER